MSFQRDHDDEPQASMTRALDTVHKPGHHVTGAGFIRPRSVVTAHDHLKSVGHDHGLREPRMHEGENKAPAAKANAEFNSVGCCDMGLTNKPGQIVASTKVN